ncbi:hypothetical protein [Marinimicrococcus flavescens]|uniref:Uncharacterized protein n=1 Tax=Marinimicrococcus flavescens TaxID=3031815 RepID=A0AAP3XRG0_9PROT|nr:hypothetical protein [Marinimicrococcus flavescens]
MDRQARLRVNLTEREYEIEGSEAFVERLAERLEAVMAELEAASADPAAPAASTEARPGERERERDGLGPFGEFIHHLPGAATEVDKMLAAGFYVQRQSHDDAFATGDASRKLSEHGVRLGNPSQCVKQSLLAKRLFMVQRGRYRISQTGRAHLRQLMGAVIPA